VIDPNGAGGFLRTLRIGNLTLQQLYDVLDSAEAKRQANDGNRVRAQRSLPEVFSYFDCTDYVDKDNDGNQRPLLTFAQHQKSRDKSAALPFYSHLRLLVAYLLARRPNVHGGYFEGILSQQLIYRLACIGYDDTIASYGGQPEFGAQCAQKQIRVLISPSLKMRRDAPAAAAVR
jgi:hypothetical protein